MPSKWFEEQPRNRNFLAPNGFKFNLELFPGVDFFCQKVSIPGISVPSAEVTTRFRNVPIASSGGLSFDDLRVEFIVDEDLKNYLSIWEWIQINNLGEHMDTKRDPQYCLGELLILNSNYQPNVTVGFEGMFPVDISELSFDIGDTEIEYLHATATFKYTRYYFNNERI